MAVKLLTYVTRSPDRDDLGLLAAFEEEVFMLAQLRHPNICLFLGVCLESPQRAIVTELVPRGSLWDALRECQLFQKVRTVLYCRLTCDIVCSLIRLPYSSAPVLVLLCLE